MNLQAQRDLSITGDVVGRDKITINITRGLDELPTRCVKPPAPSSIPPSGGREAKQIKR